MRVNGDLLIDDDLTVMGGTQVIQGSFPSLELAHPAAVANQRRWLQTTDGALFHFQALDDFNNVLASPLVLDRSGNASFSGMLTAGTAIRVRVSGNDVFFVDAQGTVTATGLGTTPLNATNLTSGTVPDARLGTNILRNPSPVDITISKLRPVLVLEDPQKPTWRTQLTQASATSLSEPRIDILGNAYHDGTNWQRYDTATPGWHLFMGNSLFRLGTVSGGPPASITTRFQVDMTNGNVTVLGTLAIQSSMTYAGQANVQCNTADGSDTGVLHLHGGGGMWHARGASLSLNGNEGPTPGFAVIRIGNASGAGFAVEKNDGAYAFQITGANGSVHTRGPLYLGENGISSSWSLQGNSSYGIYCNTGMYLNWQLWVNSSSWFNGSSEFNNQPVKRARLEGYSEAWSGFMGISGGWVTCDLNLYNVFGVNADQNFNIQFVNRKAAFSSITVVVLHNGGPFTIYWPANVRWPNSNAGDNSGAPGGSGSSRADVYTFLSWDSGSVWFGTAVKHFVWW